MSSGRTTRRKAPPRLHVLITAGPTREYLDSIRYISNPSSGKMGYALARAAQRRGHRVTLVSGPVDLMPPRGVKVLRVETGDEMARAASDAFKSAQVAVFCAAVCDYKPAHRAKRKRPKSDSPMTLKLQPTLDIAATLGKRKGRRICIGFALEDQDGARKARAKMMRKNFDAIVLNGPKNLGSDHATARLIRSDNSEVRWIGISKARLATMLVREFEMMASL